MHCRFCSKPSNWQIPGHLLDKSPGQGSTSPCSRICSNRLTKSDLRLSGWGKDGKNHHINSYHIISYHIISYLIISHHISYHIHVQKNGSNDTVDGRNPAPPCKKWDKLPINWCRISSIDSMVYHIRRGYYISRFSRPKCQPLTDYSSDLCLCSLTSTSCYAWTINK